MHNVECCPALSMKSPVAEQSPPLGRRSSEAHFPTVLSARVVLHVVLNAVVQGAPVISITIIINKNDNNNDMNNNIIIVK